MIDGFGRVIEDPLLIYKSWRYEFEKAIYEGNAFDAAYVLGNITGHVIIFAKSVEDVGRWAGRGQRLHPRRVAYEAEVAGIGARAARVQATLGENAAAVWAAFQRKYNLGLKVKRDTPAWLRRLIYRRNIKKYGDPLGPKISDMIRKRGPGRVIERASNPGGHDLKRFGVFNDLTDWPPGLAGIGSPAGVNR